MKVVFYGSNRCPVQEFIDLQPKREQAKIISCIQSLIDIGLYDSRVETRHIIGKLWELKIKGEDSAYRIFYVVLQSEVMVLLHAYKKQSQKAPRKEIVIAQRRMKEALKNESLYFRTIH